MVAAEFASNLDIKVAAVERDRVGGDCLWTGCVPSKALLASAKAAHTMRHADKYGLTPVEPEIDTARVFERIRAIQAASSPTPTTTPTASPRPGSTCTSAPPASRARTRWRSTGVGELKTRSCCSARAAGRRCRPSRARGGRLPDQRDRLGHRARAGEPGGDRRRADLDRDVAGVRAARREDHGAPEGRPASCRATSPAWSRALTDRLRSEGVDLVLDVDIESVAVRGRHEGGARAPGGQRVARRTRSWSAPGASRTWRGSVSRRSA